MAVTFMTPTACRPREELYKMQISKAGVALRASKIATVFEYFFKNKNNRQPRRGNEHTKKVWLCHK